VPDRALAVVLGLVAVVTGLLFLDVFVTKITVLSWIPITALAIYGTASASSGLAAKRLWHRPEDRALERSSE
jgi:hypothetical protein